MADSSSRADEVVRAQGAGGIFYGVWNRIAMHPDMAFTILLTVGVWTFFAVSEPVYATPRNGFAIIEGFAVLGLATLGLTVAIIAGEIDLSIGSMAALVAVIVVQLNDSIGAVPAIGVGLAIAVGFGAFQGLLIAWLRIRAIVFTVGTLMLLRGVSLFAAGEKTVILQDFAFGDFLKTRIGLFSKRGSSTSGRISSATRRGLSARTNWNRSRTSARCSSLGCTATAPSSGAPRSCSWR